MILVFDDESGEQVDLDMSALRGTPTDTAPEKPAPGRPRLGVVGREVTLLPRHWTWLNAQPGGASAALRRLVEQARRDNAAQDRVRRSQEAAYRFMAAITGDAPGFEEACRALFAGDPAAFAEQTRTWSPDVRTYATALASAALANQAGDP